MLLSIDGLSDLTNRLISEKIDESGIDTITAVTPGFLELLGKLVDQILVFILSSAHVNVQSIINRLTYLLSETPRSVTWIIAGIEIGEAKEYPMEKIKEKDEIASIIEDISGSSEFTDEEVDFVHEIIRQFVDNVIEGILNKRITIRDGLATSSNLKKFLKGDADQLGPLPFLRSSKTKLF